MIVAGGWVCVGFWFNLCLWVWFDVFLFVFWISQLQMMVTSRILMRNQAVASGGFNFQVFVQAVMALLSKMGRKIGNDGKKKKKIYFNKVEK